MKVVVVAGGTGGHFYPGLAVAHTLKSGKTDVHFFVRKKDYVIPMLEREGFSFTGLSGAGLKRAWDPRNVIVFIKLFFGFFQSIAALRKHKPNCVLAMGGYLSVMPALACKFLGIPVILHEQNVKPGLANRVLSKLATKVALSFADSVGMVRGNAFVTGLPVRSSFKSLPKQREARLHFHLEPELRTLLVFGGSQGAQWINQNVGPAFAAIKNNIPTWQILQFTGRSNTKPIEDFYHKENIRASVRDYCHEMEMAYAACDFVVCRSGASTIAELLSVKKPAFLIPYPYATAGHQSDNAKVLTRLGAAFFCEQADLTQTRFQKVLLETLGNERLLKTLNDGYQNSGDQNVNAAEKIEKLIRETV